MLWVHVLLLTFLSLLLPNVVTAKVYRCEGTNGTPILTDQPKGKRGCIAINTATPSLPGGFTPPPDQEPAVHSELPPNAIPPSLSASPMIPPQAVPGEPPLPPTESKEPSEKAAPEAQRCSPRVNPLNPFAGMNCSPAAGDASGESKKP